MTRTYLKDLKIEEIIERLKNGEKIYGLNCDGKYYYRMIDGVLCEFDENNKNVISISTFINYDNDYFYFETEETFPITHTGLYKTRDGRKAFVHFVSILAKGVIEGQDRYVSWYKQGSYCGPSYPTGIDIVSEWSEENDS